MLGSGDSRQRGRGGRVAQPSLAGTLGAARPEVRWGLRDAAVRRSSVSAHPPRQPAVIARRWWRPIAPRGACLRRGSGRRPPFRLASGARAASGIPSSRLELAGAGAGSDSAPGPASAVGISQSPGAALGSPAHVGPPASAPAKARRRPRRAAPAPQHPPAPAPPPAAENPANASLTRTAAVCWAPAALAIAAAAAA